MYNIILASGSPRRKEIFEQVGLRFKVYTSDEEEISEKLTPEEIVVDLAALKARGVADKIHEKAIIIGADTLVAMDNYVMGKPRDEKDAKAILHRLQGKKHQVHTGVSVVIKQSNEFSDSKNKVINFVESTDVWVQPMTEKQIAEYVATNEPYDKAGAYGIQGKFAINIKRIEGDYLNIVGFPIGKLYEILLKEGIDILK